MSGTVPAATPALHPANIFGAPVSTLLGLTAFVQTTLNTLATQGVPTTSAGWLQVGAGSLMGLLGLFSH